MSGIIQGSRVLIFDQCSGVITAHILERLDGVGHCVLVHNGFNSHNSIPCVNNCQFSKKVGIASEFDLRDDLGAQDTSDFTG